jgi:hypothetical protein
MILQFSHATTVGDIQKRFHQEYPYLKLEFFDKAHGWGERVDTAHKYQSEFRLSLIEKPHVGVGFLKLHPWTKTGEAEQQFLDLFGLNVQVYRKRGYDWIETAGTDELSLDEQNAIGKKSLEDYRDNLWIEREAML